MSQPEPPSDAAFASAYKELHQLAQAMFARQPGQTLQATALVNEAFLRLRSCGDETAGDPARFRRAAALAMHHILIDHARGRERVKRGGGRPRLSLDSVELCTAGDFDQILQMDDAIERLAQESPDLAEDRFYL